MSAGTMKVARLYCVSIYGALFVFSDNKAALIEKLAVYTSTKPRMVKLELTPEGREELEQKGLSEYRFRWKISTDSTLYMDVQGDLLGYNEIEVLTKFDEPPFVIAQDAPLLFAKGMCPCDTFGDIKEVPNEEATAAAKAIHDKVLANDLAHGIMREPDALSEKLDAALKEHGPNPPKEVMDALIREMGERVSPHLKHLYQVSPQVTVESADGITYLPCGVTDFDDAAVIIGGKLSAQPLLRVCSLQQPTWKPVDKEKHDSLYNMGYRGAWVFPKGALGEKNGDDMVGFAVLDGLPILVKTPESINPAGELAIPGKVYEALGGSLEGKAPMSREQAEAFNLKHGARLNAANSVPRTAN